MIGWHVGCSLCSIVEKCKGILEVQFFLLFFPFLLFLWGGLSERWLGYGLCWLLLIIPLTFLPYHSHSSTVLASPLWNCAGVHMMVKLHWWDILPVLQRHQSLDRHLCQWGCWCASVYEDTPALKLGLKNSYCKIEFYPMIWKQKRKQQLDIPILSLT